MVIILDDTFDSRHKYNDVSFLVEQEYSRHCMVYEKPTMKDFRHIADSFDKIALVCNHRSLRLFKNGIPVNGEDHINGFYQRVQHQNIPRVEFGRDTHSNFNAKTLDKNTLYSNLRPFIDSYIEHGDIELKILFYGNEYREIERLTAIDKLMDEISVADTTDFTANKQIVEGIKLLIPESDPITIIEEWVSCKLSKKAIRLFINKRI